MKPKNCSRHSWTLANTANLLSLDSSAAWPQRFALDRVGPLGSNACHRSTLQFWEEMHGEGSPSGQGTRLV